MVNVRGLPYVIPDSMSPTGEQKGGEPRKLAKRSLSGRRGSLGESGARPIKNEEVREHGEGHPEVPTGSHAHGRGAAGFLRGRAWFYTQRLMADGRPDATGRRASELCEELDFTHLTGSTPF